MNKYTDSVVFPSSEAVKVGREALYLFEDSPLSSPSRQRRTESKPWYKWGDDDNLPQRIFDRCAQNDSMFNAIDTSASLMVGSGVYCFREVFENNEIIQVPQYVPEFEDFIEQSNYNEFLYQNDWNKEFSANSFALFKINAAGKVQEVKAYDPQDCRAEYYTGNQILNYYTCGDFTRGKYTGKEDHENSVHKIKSTVQIDLAAPKMGNYMMHNRYHMAGQKYYSFPRWWFGLKAWLELSNLIPRFQLANIKNGISPKYLIKMPENLFAHCKDEKEKLKKKQQLIDDFERKIAGADNAGKTIAVFKTYIGDKEISIDIVPIDFKQLDNVFLNTFDVSARAISRGIGIDPSLAGMDSGGKLGSGSDKVQTYNFHMVKQSPKEMLSLKELYLVKKINKWPADLKFGLRKRIFTSMDKNPTGTENAF